MIMLLQEPSVVAALATVPDAAMMILAALFVLG